MKLSKFHINQLKLQKFKFSNKFMYPKENHWDVFCKIVDNYGDIGVCWRLSQQLAHDYNISVRLFIDDFFTARKIITSLDVTKQFQIINNIEVYAWPTFENVAKLEPANVVLECFGCGLPDGYALQMQTRKSIWINLEYLSAENWVSDFHGKPSPQTTLTITKHFFFPGFRNDTGGLIRESKLIKMRDLFLSSKSQKIEFWQRLGISNDNYQLQKSIKISLFCYPEADIHTLFETLAKSPIPITLFLPVDNTVTTIKNLIIDFDYINDKVFVKESLTIFLLPFLSQPDYDKLLWVCDLNFVRGEDSWIRAIWSGKPFIWQPYFQAENAHIKKLNAFLYLYSSSAPYKIKTILKKTHLAWAKNVAIDKNHNPLDKISKVIPSQSAIWNSLIDLLPSLHTYANQISNTYATQPDLATKLVIFSENVRKNKV